MASTDSRPLPTVAVAAPDLITRAGIAYALSNGGMEVTEEDACDVVVLAIEDVDDESLARVRGAAEKTGHPVVLVVPAVDDAQLLQAVEAGAGAVLCRAEATTLQLCGAACEVARGNAYLSPQLLGVLFRGTDRLRRQRPAVVSDPVQLSERERSILRLVADGYSTPEIAMRLGWSTRTVKASIQRAMVLLQAANRTQAVACAFRLGLL